MIALDTNVLLRYFAQDDPVQSPRATALLERRLTPANPAFISVVVIAELVWTLSRKFASPREELVRILLTLLASRTLTIEHAEHVATATTALKDGFGFADVLIERIALAAGADHTLTFDRKAARLPGFKLL